MPSRQLKSSMKHPYMKETVPFWRPQGRLFGYSESVKDQLERHKLEFEANMKYIQWQKQ